MAWLGFGLFEIWKDMGFQREYLGFGSDVGWLGLRKQSGFSITYDANVLLQNILT